MGIFKGRPIKNGHNRIRIRFQYLATLCNSCGKLDSTFQRWHVGISRRTEPRLTNYNLGASAIFALSRDLNLMLETVAGWNEDIAEGVLSPEATVNHSTTALISPGAHYAFNLPNDAQLVVGLGLLIGLTSDSPDWVSPFTVRSSMCSCESKPV